MTKVIFPFCRQAVGGSDYSAIEVMQVLRDAGYEVGAILHRKNKHLEKLLDESGFDYQYIPTKGAIGKNPIYALFALVNIVRFYYVLKRQNVDIIHTNDTLTHRNWTISCWLANVPHIWHQRVLLHRKLDCFLLNNSATKSIFVSNYAASTNMGDRVQQDKKTVIHNCVQIPKNFQTMKEKATPSLNDPIKIGYFGGLKSAKRPFLFMEIASCLNNMGYDHFEFYFYGPEPPEGEVSFDQFSNYRDKLGLNSNLYYVGHVMEPVKHINQMDIILSLWPEEPFGRIPIEAVLCGAVAIVANSGGHQETVDDYVSGFKVSDYQNPQSYADKIIEVIAHFENNPDRFNEFLVNAKHAMKTKFQTQKFAAEIINLYTELTSLHP